MSKPWKDSSRTRWSGDDWPGIDQVKVGCLQRIADACEAMSDGHIRLASERDMYKRLLESERESAARLVRRLSAARGVATKLRKQLARRR